MFMAEAELFWAVPALPSAWTLVPSLFAVMSTSDPVLAAEQE